MGRGKEKEGERKVRGEGSGGRGKGKGSEGKREEKERKGEGEGRDAYPTFWYKMTPMSARDIHKRRIGLATRNQSALFMMSINTDKC